MSDRHDHDHDHAQGDDAGPVVPLVENGKRYWRSLDSLAETEEFQAFVHREFPEQASELLEPVTRRDFLSIMSASIALAGLGTAGCIRRPEEHIVPYVKRPEDLVPGLPQFYATAMPVAGSVTGLVVEAHEGRPTKIEGNPLHPASLGAACTYEQAAVLDLYDPDRLTGVFRNEQRHTWAEFETWLAERTAALKANGGQGLWLVHEAVASPTFDAAKARLASTYPNARLVEWEALSDDDALAGTRLAFGEPLEAVYRLDRADTIAAFHADLFGEGPLHLRYAKEWARRRDPAGHMNRLYVAEPTFTPTGAVADHRARLRAEEVGPALRVLAAKLAARGVALPPELASTAKAPAGLDRWLEVLAKELSQNRGRGLVAVGRRMPAEVQAIAHAIDLALGNVGTTVEYFRPASPPAVPHREAIRQLAAALDAGQVDTLVLVGGNPAYNAPAELALRDRLKKATHRIHLTSHANETTAACEWALPQAHFLEAWGDGVSHDGTYAPIQPLIQPIWEGRSGLELLALWNGEKAKGVELVRAEFARRFGEGAWRKALHDGVVEGSAGAAVTPALAAAAGEAFARVPAEAKPTAKGDLELDFLVDAKVFDGRYANNAWLQELPDPMTKLTWTNAVLLSPRTADELGLKSRDVVRVKAPAGELEAPVWVQPGTADGVAALALGYGRTRAGRIGNGRGADAFRLRTADGSAWVRGVSLAATGGTALLPTTQDHHTIEGRPLVREGSQAEYLKNPAFAREMVHEPPKLSLWQDHEYKGQQWGMAIDLNSCLGCNGCMIACQAENNIPVVGPEQVQKGREMHWIRLDRYFVGDDAAEPEVALQPMTCQHCENAPCETVCPVAATVHAHDGGFNDMVYNRCIGTRYCSNNCPWKVRRFNFLNYHLQEPGQIEQLTQLRFNPDVTVRTRGVMEKCTFCVQRVNSARRAMKLSGAEKIPDGEVVPACAQACPTDAIVFGDVNDPNTKVSKLKGDPRNYATLAELNTRPRTTYLAKIKNPNPELT